MNLPIRRVSNQEVKDSSESFTDYLNTFFFQISKAFRKGISFSKNIASDIKEIEISDNIAKFMVLRKPIGVTIIETRKNSKPVQIVNYSYLTGNLEIKLDGIVDKTFVKFLVIYE